MDGWTAAPPEQKEKLKKAFFWIVAVIVVAICLIGAFGPDSDTSVPAPTADERSGTVPILKAATDSQGICYGWRLSTRWDDVSVGSNHGDGVPVPGAPGCTRWIEVTTMVRYSSMTSENDEDSVVVSIEGSDDITYADLAAIETGLSRFGLDPDAFLDDPGWAVTRAATILPLLAAERGLAGPAAAPTAAPSTAAAPLPDAGNDFWRDRWIYVLSSFGLFLLAALFIAVGVRQRRNHRVRVLAQRAAAGAAGRTRSIR
ncbi:hypothetical protein AMK25_04410 [Micromonospora sp. TSRI0369]|uniref:hypothetical protein n=1 Tax=Micromonospora sp. TSRI0369 TaxID=1703936 RepID=UPI00093D36E0|nr:hypothetical protein [Micromonospora sp. TSRI0369]OKJ47844.1 hypothetical protein AMK25_04410 [Micromonospora sp. TSRI0369]